MTSIITKLESEIKILETKTDPWSQYVRMLFEAELTKLRLKE